MRIKMKSERTIKKELKALRQIVEESKDPAEQRVAYIIEQSIRWTTEKTVGWSSPAEGIGVDVKLLKQEMGVQP